MSEWVSLSVLFVGVTGLGFALFLLLRPRRLRPEDLLRETDDAEGTGRRLILGPLTEAMSKQVPLTQQARLTLQQDLRAAGFYRSTALTEYAAVRTLLVVAPIILAGILSLLVHPTRVVPVLLSGLVCAILGFSLPRVYLAVRGRARGRAIERGLPLIIDLITLCLTAGQNLMAALAQTSRHLHRSHPVLAQELAIIHQQANLHSLEHALKQWADRVRLPAVRNLALLLIQSEKLGTDAATTLQEMATNFRTTARQRAESQANRTSFWMLFPSVFCFWVAAAIVLIAPAYLEFFQHQKQSAKFFHQSRQNIERANERKIPPTPRAGRVPAAAAVQAAP